MKLKPIKLSEEYRKEWNVSSRLDDFCVLTDDFGNRLNDSVYRRGGLFSPSNDKDLNNRYFILFKQVESFYPDSIMIHLSTNDNKYLDNCSCIIDQNGVEKYVKIGGIDYPYLIKDSCIYHVSSKYYNIETNECYCRADNSMACSDFLFLENKYDRDVTKRGIIKIDKKTGISELLVW